MAPSATPLEPLIPASILTNNMNLQANSALLTTLPTELLHRVLLFAISSWAATPDITTRVFLTLSCKLLGATLASAISTPRKATPGVARDGVLRKRDIPRNIYSKNAPIAQINARSAFMVKLGAWLKEEDGWAYCSVCLVYKQLEGGGLGAEKESWRSVKKVIESKASGTTATAAGSGEDAVTIKVEDEDENDTSGKGLGLAERAGWLRMDDEHLICPPHRFSAVQMVMLRDK